MAKKIRVNSCGTCPFKGCRRFLQEDERRVEKVVCTNPDTNPKTDKDWIVILQLSAIHPECPLEDDDEKVICEDCLYWEDDIEECSLDKKPVDCECDSYT